MPAVNTIRLVNLLPRVFRQADNPAPARGDLSSDKSGIWLHEVTINRGDRLCIQAESGSGKSSLIGFIYGARTDYDGSIMFDGQDIRTFGMDYWCGLRQHSLSLLPQHMELFGELTAIENIEIKNRLTGTMSHAEIRAMLGDLGIPDGALTRPVNRLSVGQQQRVAIVRALCQPFDFLLLDEPVSHLDADCNRAVAAMIAHRADALGAAVITTSVGNPLLLPKAEILTL